jgi:hypothetical protein
LGAFSDLCVYDLIFDLLIHVDRLLLTLIDVMADGRSSGPRCVGLFLECVSPSCRQLGSADAAMLLVVWLAS